ncbi:MAG: hypothetical protein E5W59_18160, partial [Mesorhizobium sp.]
LVVGRNINVAQKAVGLLYDGDPGQRQFFRQPVLQGLENPLRTTACLRRIGRDMLDAKVGQRAADLGQVCPVDFSTSLRRMEIVAASISIEAQRQTMAKDLSSLVEFPQSYRHAGVPRSISWEQVEQVLAGIDRRSTSGKRDYAMMMLLATYGLRAAEVATLTLDDIDWRNERLKIRDRKAGTTTTYPLSAAVGAAIIEYLKNGRPATTCREVFMRCCAPHAGARIVYWCGFRQAVTAIAFVA